MTLCYWLGYYGKVTGLHHPRNADIVPINIIRLYDIQHYGTLRHDAGHHKSSWKSSQQSENTPSFEKHHHSSIYIKGLTIFQNMTGVGRLPLKRWNSCLHNTRRHHFRQWVNGMVCSCWLLHILEWWERSPLMSLITPISAMTQCHEKLSTQLAYTSVSKSDSSTF